jgi:glycolate oxidase FAD binding subunit
VNLSGPGRYRYGGVRDFILGVRFFDNQARLIRSGGKVVKNAAGFDISKLMVGSLGSLGTLVELSFKVFPRPLAYITLSANFPSIQNALDSLFQLITSPIEVLCLEIEPKTESWELRIRLGGTPELFNNRIERLKQYIGDVEILEGDAEAEYWEELVEFNWVPKEAILVKIPLTSKLVPELDTFLQQNEAVRRYSVGANVAWVAWSKPLEILDQHLKEVQLVGLTILGSTNQTHLGVWESGSFYQRIKKALDPTGKWAEV